MVLEIKLNKYIQIKYNHYLIEIEVSLLYMVKIKKLIILNKSPSFFKKE